MPPKKGKILKKEDSDVEDDDDDNLSVSSISSSDDDSSSSSSDYTSTTSSDSDDSYLSDVGSSLEDEQQSVKSSFTQKSKRNISKNIFNQYKLDREKHYMKLLKNKQQKELNELNIDMSKLLFLSKENDNIHDNKNNKNEMIEYVSNCYSNYNSGLDLWSHPKFSNIMTNFQYESDIIINPPHISEGAVECPKCRSNKTFYYSKQTRSADEPMTTFIKCYNLPKCGKVSRQ